MAEKVEKIFEEQQPSDLGNRIFHLEQKVWPSLAFSYLKFSSSDITLNRTRIEIFFFVKLFVTWAIY